MDDDQDRFIPADDGLHTSSTDYYETETFWFSFFVPDRAIGAWLYAAVKHNAGGTGGGCWIWDAAGSAPWDIPFYEQFGHLKAPRQTSSGRLEFPTGLTVEVREPALSYRLGYDDRNRCRIELRFDALEPPVPLRRGAPPYPKAAHYDQTGHVTGHLLLDGERIDVDCYAMRDRSWGRRTERGYRRVGYTWAASPDLSLLTYTSPEARAGGVIPENVHSGYLRRDGRVARIVGGHRTVHRDPKHGWITGIDLEVVDDDGRALAGRAEPASRMILPGATTLCVNTSLVWNLDGRTVYGEDQDVCPIHEWQYLRSATRSRSGSAG
ncbi:hypothetical protein [Frankia sp. QA3]|uniref:DUF7065 domain-containing protein n=1 Tax=Frankia sp. QA3 TaxID=710111 RepID=UPI000269BC75|nr:hypothetical protein [Frankia sp. QA3]EIV92683.1 hypothetical protein FraQA3DRAFT_2291 [Frankia sp. QA3]